MTTAPGYPVLRLRQTIDDVLGGVLAGGSPVALVDYPNHDNPGDCAIWLGETAFLHRTGHPVAYRSDMSSHSPRALQRRIGRAPILLHGGGNFGDIWSGPQLFREQLVAAFPQNPIIQLPQTIHFTDERNLRRARAAFDRHPDVTLLVRDRRSLDFARRHFRARSALCPDMAFALGALERPVGPTQPIVRLARSDAEASPASATACSTPRLDWLTSSTRRYAAPGLRNRALGRLSSRHPALFRAAAGAPLHSYEVLAAERLRYGVGMIAQGRAVITDRLHGHIVSLLLGIPHVLLDNSYGKLRGFYETWTHGSDLALWADSPALAERIAESLASPTPPKPNETERRPQRLTTTNA